MTGFEVDPEELRAMADAVAASVPTIAEQASALHAATDAGAADTAYTAYTDAAAALHRLVAECAARLEAVATGLAAAAARYAAVEEDAGSTVRGAGDAPG